MRGGVHGLTDGRWARVRARSDGGDRTEYGIGASEDMFKWWSATELGANKMGVASASQLSYRAFAASGFVALYFPFFSETLLPDQEGNYTQVMDHRPHMATPTNGKAPTYYCARSSFNGHHIVQKCNPNPSVNSAVARQMFTEMLDRLKKVNPTRPRHRSTPTPHHG